MYFAEDIIDGILCWRSSPNGVWTPYTLKDMAVKHEQQRLQISELEQQHYELVKML